MALRRNSPDTPHQRYNEDFLLMNRARTTTWPLVAAIGLVLGGVSAQGGEVTVVGSRWQSPTAPISKAPDTLDGAALPSDGALTPPAPEKAPAGGPVDETPASEFGSTLSDYFGDPPSSEFWGPRAHGRDKPCRVWTIDYRFRTFFASGTSRESGTAQPPPIGWTPAERLNLALNSDWHGLRIGVGEPTWGVQFEWMMPQQGIQGGLEDYEWNPPNRDGSYTDLGLTTPRWSGGFGQYIDFGLEFQLTERTFDRPVEIWPMAGFRWQRFQVTGYELNQVKLQNVWLDPPLYRDGDILLFNQQYYTGYLGGQLRMRILALSLTFQADWGYTWGYNVEHDLLAPGNRYTMDATRGDSWHIAVVAEVRLDDRISIGFQYDHLAISTIGTHHLLNLPRGEDMTWDNGVAVSSNQNWMTGFLRFRF
jgi:hypothetical protein